MGLEMPLPGSFPSLAETWPCRDGQLRQLSALLSPSLPNPSSVVIHGPQATGKSEIIKAYLQRSGLDHAIIQCRESVTGRHLLEEAVDAVVRATQATGRTDVSEHNSRCENLSAFAIHLLRHLTPGRRFVLVFDDVDQQREAPPTLIPALARLGEKNTGLTVVLVVQHAPAHFLHRTGVPHVHFPAYSRGESIHIVSKDAPDIFEEPPREDLDYDQEVHEEDKAWLWPRFCAAVWDALAQNAARDLDAFRGVCYKLWRPFVAPIMKGDFGTRDFSRLLVAQRRLFQDEAALLDSILVDSDTSQPEVRSKVHELPYFAKWLIVAAYLASFNPARTDALHFMKATERKRRKKGGGTARAGGGRASQNRKTPRHLLGASSFTLDRVLAILHAILPDELRTSIDMYKQIATLGSLRLLQRAGGIGSGDPLEPGGKWKVGPMVTWEYAQGLARALDFTLTDYLAD